MSHRFPKGLSKEDKETLANGLENGVKTYRKQCSYAKKYKGIRKPTCGCETCAKKWGETQNNPNQ